MFKKHYPDIIIADINVPEMNGLNMSEKILETSLSNKPIIMPAHEEKKYFLQAVAAGVFSLLNKPVKRDTLADTYLEVPNGAHPRIHIPEVENIRKPAFAFFLAKPPERKGGF